MKKILFLINTLEGGGAEKVLVDTVNGLVNENIDITVQTIFNDGVHSSRLNSKIKYKKIIRTKSKFLQNLLTRLFLRVLSSKFIYIFFIKEDYDCEIAFLEGFPTKIISNSTNKKAKKIAWVHTDLIEFPNSVEVFGTEENEKKAYSKFDSIACVSNGVKDAFIKKYGKDKQDVQTVYNIFDEKEIIEYSNEHCEINKQYPLIVSVGRLTELKGYDRLLKVYKRLIEEKFFLELWIVGEGAQRLKLETYIKENGLDEAKILGFQKNPYKYMQKADVFVSASIVEGYSTVVTEAAILGIPIISTNTAGAKEPLEAPRCSVIVEDEEELYLALKTILTDKNQLDILKNEAKQKQEFFKQEKFLNKIKLFLEI